MHEPLTARRVADALGRHVVRGLYEPTDDDSGPSLPELQLRFRLPDGSALLALFDADGQSLTDGGMALSDLRGRSVPAAVRAVAALHGVRVGHEAPWELSRQLDAADPAEDAMAFVACLLQVAALTQIPAADAAARPARRSA